MLGHCRARKGPFLGNRGNLIRNPCHRLGLKKERGKSERKGVFSGRKKAHSFSEWAWVARVWLTFVLTRIRISRKLVAILPRTLRRGIVSLSPSKSHVPPFFGHRMELRTTCKKATLASCLRFQVVGDLFQCNPEQRRQKVRISYYLRL